jgi:replicative superfamily II helicase
MSFIVLTKDQFEDILPNSYEEIDVKGCKEYVYQVDTKNENINVRIYSTVDKGTNQTRDKGADAIRIVYWAVRTDRPIGKSKKILRVEGKTTIQERITSRIEEFLNGAHEQNDGFVDPLYIEAILTHPSIQWNGFAKSLYDGFLEYNNLTPGQLAWVIGDKNPKGRPLSKNTSAQTFEAFVKEENPAFFQDFLDAQGEESDENDDTISEDTPKDEQPFESRGEFWEENTFEREKYKSKEAANEEPSGLDPIFITSDGTDIDLVPTKDYKPYQYPFAEFNPVQSISLPYKDKDVNMVIAANTSAGKTIAVEPMMDATLKDNKKVLYLAPLKALVSEKFDDWQVRFPDKKIAILTGDYVLTEKMKLELNTADIIVLTSEMLDSRTRKMESEQNFFLKMAGLLLVDEAHVLTMPERGHAMEVAMMRFSSINSYCRIILISATMPNVKELGEWLTVLNSKQSVVIHCNWRPVELQLHFKEHPILTRSNGWPDYWGTQDAKKEMAIDIAMQKPDEMFLIFVHDKATGRDLIKKFKKVGESVVFHNADLEKTKRQELEANFRTRNQRIMISTSTTAFGLNLPARNVIIVGTHRGINDVDSLEIIQEIGRAGRYGIDDEGHAFIIVPEGTRGSWERAILNPRPVNSVLNRKEILAFHALAEITNKVITDEWSLSTWYDRSLAGKQNIIPFGERDAKGLFDDLTKMEMIKFQGIQPYVTGLGKVSSWLYFSPYDVYCWYTNFESIYNGDTPLDDLSLAWALTDTPSNNPGYVVSSMKNTAEDWRFRLKNRGIHCSDAILSVIAAYEQLTGQTNGVGGAVNVLKRGIIFDIDRVKQALSLIDGLHAKWNQDKLWEVLSPRIKYGVPLEMIDLVRVPSIGGARARKLWDQGIQSPEDIVKTDMPTLKSILGANVASKAKIGAAKMMSAF